MKLIDKDALVAEIKRQISAIDDCPKITNTQISVLAGNKVVLTKLLSFIDTLEVKEVQEEPVSDDLEDAAKEYAKAKHQNEALIDIVSIDFKAGAKWQREKNKNLPKIWPRDTIEEYAYQVAYDLSNDWARDYPEWEDVETACKLGAEWQEKQMTKKAVDGYIERDEGGQLILDLTDLAAPGEFIILKSSAYQEIKCGERHPIRLIIIKKE